MGRRKSKFRPEIQTPKAWRPKLGNPNYASSSCPPPSPPPPPALFLPPVPSPPPLWTERPRDITADTLPPPWTEWPRDITVDTPPPRWTELPRDITANILQRLGALEILESAQRVCTTWRRVSQDPAMWRVIDMNYFDKMAETEMICYVNIPNVCRLAVDRSQGQLIDLRLHYRADDELLNYIVQRSSKLRRLTMTFCNRITGACLVEAVKRLPHLEELHLIIEASVEAANFEAIRISCPTLKSFTLNKRGGKNPLTLYLRNNEPRDNVYALAIAKTMPNLRHLRLLESSMNNKGLEAILDGCPHLESLDIRKCSNLDLQGELGRRLSEQIKSLKLPFDSISDIDWFVGDDSAFPLYDFGYDDDFDYDYGYDDGFEYYDYDDYADQFGLFDVDELSIYGHDDFWG